MSNFTCPTCGLTNIDCGKAGYKTAREIELEKKLEIAVKALEQYAFAEKIADSIFNGKYTKKYAQEALAKIKEVKK